MSDTRNLLWHYSLALYKEIEPWCLQMQDDHNANVNLLLLCCFAGSRGCCLTIDQLSDAENAIASWDEQVVQPLRQLRRQLPLMQHGDAKQLLLDAELKAEHHIQSQLWQWWQQQPESDRPADATAIAANLNLYISQLGASLTPATVIDCAVRAAG
ncbi:TIGR02444 family protein [Porticoccus sp. W117]|uniref:TIGR02444 family protein n=1 Tax=Porticoccus sp. W117 TaxID=3054777 RepID=UPI00259A0B75|nr:TIGR02444 family protein [Porticoccus sp. W117]MDM3870868.1 TIGR02444 family protein [Porticoccus sp. W117]